MSHRAAVYLVRVHPLGRPDEYRLLGDFDDQGSSLIDALKTYLPKVEFSDEPRQLRYLSSSLEGDDLLAMFEHCQTGLDATIRNAGEVRYHQLVEDSQDIEAGCLWRLPGNNRTGWLAIHIPNRRGMKSMLATDLERKFRSQFHGFVLSITPYVLASALQRAIDENRIRTVTLVRRVPPTDRAISGIEQWIPDNSYGKIRLTIGSSMSGKLRHIVAEPLRRYLAGETGSRQAIVEFKGMTFDEAKVEVQQGDSIRTFNVEQPESGHPFTETMDLDSRTKPAPDAIFAGLRAALRTAQE